MRDAFRNALSNYTSAYRKKNKKKKQDYNVRKFYKLGESPAGWANILSKLADVCIFVLIMQQAHTMLANALTNCEKKSGRHTENLRNYA